jgi:hypothetical protein
MVIQYYADSLGLPRLGHVGITQRYIFLLESELRKRTDENIIILDRSRRGATIDELFEVYSEDEGYFTEGKDVLILHEGICDCAPRPIPGSLRRLISALPGFLKYRIIAFLHKKRAILLRNGFVHYLVNRQRFEDILLKWLTDAVKKFKRIYVLNIAPTNDAIEAHSPGLRKSIGLYNESIRKVIAELGDDKISLIDCHSAISGSEYTIDQLVIKEDGHHLTALGHEIYARMIADRELALLKKDA